MHQLVELALSSTPCQPLLFTNSDSQPIGHLGITCSHFQCKCNVFSLRNMNWKHHLQPNFHFGSASMCQSRHQILLMKLAQQYGHRCCFPQHKCVGLIRFKGDYVDYLWVHFIVEDNHQFSRIIINVTYTMDPLLQIFSVIVFNVLH